MVRKGDSNSHLESLESYLSHVGALRPCGWSGTAYQSPLPSVPGDSLRVAMQGTSPTAQSSGLIYTLCVSCAFPSRPTQEYPKLSQGEFDGGHDCAKFERSSRFLHTLSVGSLLSPIFYHCTTEVCSRIYSPNVSPFVTVATRARMACRSSPCQVIGESGFKNWR